MLIIQWNFHLQDELLRFREMAGAYISVNLFFVVVYGMLFVGSYLRSQNINNNRKN